MCLEEWRWKHPKLQWLTICLRSARSENMPCQRLYVPGSICLKVNNDPSGVPQMQSLLNGILVINGLRKSIWSCWGFSCRHGQQWLRELHLKHFENLPMDIRKSCFRRSLQCQFSDGFWYIDQSNVNFMACFETLAKRMSMLLRVLRHWQKSYRLYDVLWHIGKQ